MCGIGFESSPTLGLHVLQAYQILSPFFIQTGVQNICIIILTQAEPYHASVSKLLKDDIENQSLEGGGSPKIYLSHIDFPVAGAWTIIPLLASMVERHSLDEIRWIFFVEPHTTVRLKVLVDVLKDADKVKGPQWIGYPLTDAEPTIIHHYTSFEELAKNGEKFSYPYFAAGFAINMELIKWLVTDLKSDRRMENTDFSIDPAFELAQLIYGDPKNPGPLLNGDQRFCAVSEKHCATYPKPFLTCGRAIEEGKIFFAVKTFHSYHDNRARVVKKTWGAHVTNILFFSDVEDDTLPSIDVGVPNTKRGHCAKTVAILKYLTNRLKSSPHIEWVFLADDDTILGVKRLTELLSCHRGTDSLTVIGERYGYGYWHKTDSRKGYDYITGGGGTAMSRAAVTLLSSCVCPQPDAPDDMTIGACAVHLFNITLTHSSLFHQARPMDYSAEYLSRDRPVSFHKHWMIDPVAVYNEWFRSDDLTIQRKDMHNEL